MVITNQNTSSSFPFSPIESSPHRTVDCIHAHSENRVWLEHPPLLISGMIPFGRATIHQKTRPTWQLDTTCCSPSPSLYALCLLPMTLRRTVEDPNHQRAATSVKPPAARCSSMGHSWTRGLHPYPNRWAKRGLLKTNWASSAADGDE